MQSKVCHFERNQKSKNLLLAILKMIFSALSPNSAVKCFSEICRHPIARCRKLRHNSQAEFSFATARGHL